MNVKQQSFSILLVDDEQDFCRSLATLISREGWHVATESDPKAVLPALEQRPVNLVVLDRRMPGFDGINLLKLLKERYPATAVIMLSGHSDVDAIVDAMKYGATNFFVKPPKIPELLLEIERLQETQSKKTNAIGFAGIAPAMQALQRDLIKAAPTDASVLVQGESGTGKELVAETLHKHSKRHNKSFVKINCAAIAESLLESELFGHEKGAFTHATSSHRGRFEQADQGTLFLDEIGDMSLATQAKILRLLQEQSFERVGGERSIQVDVRIVAATNRDLVAMVEEGTFREDLYYRLAVIQFQLPPLRDRAEDVVPLANHFAQHFSQHYGKTTIVLAKETEIAFQKHRWPGNVRELKNCVERAVIFCEGGEIRLSDLSNQYQNIGDVDANPLEHAIDQVNRTAIINALENSGWKKQDAAKALNINRRTLYNRMKKLGLN